jgi:hypothetical protein
LPKDVLFTPAISDAAATDISPARYFFMRSAFSSGELLVLCGMIKAPFIINSVLFHCLL